MPNYGRAGHGPLLREGMVLAIEPMLSAGTPRIKTLEDGWTVITADRSLSAHFEHTVGITKDGPRVLTRADSAPAIMDATSGVAGGTLEGAVPAPEGGGGPFRAWLYFQALLQTDLETQSEGPKQRKADLRAL